MSERKQLTIWVSESQRDNWDEYQEELGFQNRAEFIRRAVEYYYRDKTSDKTLAHELEDTVETLSEDFQDDLYDIQRDIESIKSSVQQDPDLDILKADIYDYLPNIPLSKVKEMEFEGGSEEWHDSWSAKTPTELADEFDRSHSEAVRACEALRIEGPEVKVREVDDVRYYYKQEMGRQ